MLLNCALECVNIFKLVSGILCKPFQCEKAYTCVQGNFLELFLWAFLLSLFAFLFLLWKVNLPSFTVVGMAVHYGEASGILFFILAFIHLNCFCPCPSAILMCTQGLLFLTSLGLCNKHGFGLLSQVDVSLGCR